MTRYTRLVRRFNEIIDAETSSPASDLCYVYNRCSFRPKTPLMKGSKVKRKWDQLTGDRFQVKGQVTHHLFSTWAKTILWIGGSQQTSAGKNSGQVWWWVVGTRRLAVGSWGGKLTKDGWKHHLVGSVGAGPPSVHAGFSVCLWVSHVLGAGTWVIRARHQGLHLSAGLPSVDRSTVLRSGPLEHPQCKSGRVVSVITERTCQSSGEDERPCSLKSVYSLNRPQVPLHGLFNALLQGQSFKNTNFISWSTCLKTSSGSYCF